MLLNTANWCNNWQQLIFFGIRNDSVLGPIRENSVEMRVPWTNCTTFWLRN